MSETTEPDGLRKLIESYSQQLNSTNVMYDDEFEAAIRQYFAARLDNVPKTGIVHSDSGIRHEYVSLDDCRRAIEGEA